MIKQKKYAYYLIPKNIVNKQKYLVYFLECMFKPIPVTGSWIALDHFIVQAKDELGP